VRPRVSGRRQIVVRSDRPCSKRRQCKLSFDRGRLLVADYKGGNSVQVLNPDGSLFASITDPMFNNPWGVTSGFPHFFAPISTFFVGNKSAI
jgi:hypothetical protein